MNPAERTNASPPASSAQIEERATFWLAKRYGGLSAEEAVALDAWLAADPRHAQAFIQLEQAWKIISSPGAAGQGHIARERERVRRRFRARRRRAVLVAASLMVAAFVTWTSFSSRQTDALPAAIEGIALRPDVRVLPDGSSVQLNARAEVALAFTPEKRVLQLVRGEALFTVAKDEARPFVVLAGTVEVRAVGTAFTVRRDSEIVGVLVTEGTVAVERIASGPAQEPAAEEPDLRVEPMRVTAGQRVVLSTVHAAAPTQVAPVTAAEISQALAWRERRIEFTRTPLANAVELFNRQNQTQLVVADGATSNFEISGIFWVDDPDSFVRLLVSAFGVQADRTGRAIYLSGR